MNISYLGTCPFCQEKMSSSTVTDGVRDMGSHIREKHPELFSDIAERAFLRFCSQQIVADVPTRKRG